MQSCAFFWRKINMIRAYMGGSDLAIVLGARWLAGHIWTMLIVGEKLAMWKLSPRSVSGILTLKSERNEFPYTTPCPWRIDTVASFNAM
jgi:hypothetical protein